MLRLLAFCVLLAVSLATIASAAPVPTHLVPKDPPFAFPTKVGTTWVYEEDGEEKTLVISHCKDEADGKLITTEWVGKDGNREPDMVMSVNKKGLFLVEQDGEKYDTPFCMVKLPHRDGEKWKLKISRSGIELSGTITAGPIERIKVPAGDFDAARFDWDFTLTDVADEKGKVTCWYANGVGLVKVGDTRKLKSFKPGKD